MSGARWETGNGRGGLTGFDTTGLPDGYTRDGTRRGVLYVHGAGELSPSMLNTAGSNKLREGALIAAIAATRPLVSFDAGVFGTGGVNDSDNWGSANAIAQMTLAVAWLKNAAGGGAKAGKVHLVGISMGHALSMTWAQAGANAASTASIVGVLPVNDLDDIRDNNRGGYRASISTALGASPWVAPGNPALPATANPALPANQTNLRTIPQKLWAASDDAICTLATATALVANLGSICTLVNMGVGGHTDTSVGNVAIADVLAFLAAND